MTTRESTFREVFDFASLLIVPTDEVRPILLSTGGGSSRPPTAWRFRFPGGPPGITVRREWHSGRENSKRYGRDHMVERALLLVWEDPLSLTFALEGADRAIRVASYLAGREVLPLAQEYGGKEGLAALAERVAPLLGRVAYLDISGRELAGNSR